MSSEVQLLLICVPYSLAVLALVIWVVRRTVPLRSGRVRVVGFMVWFALVVMPIAVLSAGGFSLFAIGYFPDADLQTSLGAVCGVLLLAPYWLGLGYSVYLRYFAESSVELQENS